MCTLTPWPFWLGFHFVSSFRCARVESTVWFELSNHVKSNDHDRSITRTCTTRRRLSQHVSQLSSHAAPYPAGRVLMSIISKGGRITCADCKSKCLQVRAPELHPLASKSASGEEMPLPVLVLVLALSTIVCGAGDVTNATGMVCRQLWARERSVPKV